jgi:hypothetical protein
LYFSPNVIGVIKSRRMRWVGRRREKPEEKRLVVPLKGCYEICTLLAFYIS